MEFKQQWTVASSSGGGSYVVSLTEDNVFQCGCPGWTRNVRHICPECHTDMVKVGKGVYSCRLHGQREAITKRQDCKHILAVKRGGGTPMESAVLNRLTGLGEDRTAEQDPGGTDAYNELQEKLRKLRS